MQNKGDLAKSQMNDQLLLACENANIPMVRQLIRQGASIDVMNTAGESALHLAVKSGNLWMVNYLVEEILAPVNVRDSFGRTPLHWAAHKGNAFMVESLIMAGADIEAEDEKGIRVITYAEREGHSDIIKLLAIVMNSRVRN